MKVRVRLLILLLWIATGCSREYWPGVSKEDHVQKLSMPEDESTPWQRRQIEDTKKRIARYAGEIGVNMDLDRIPVIVRSSNPQNAGLNGTCNYDSDGTPRFIEIYTDVFKYEIRHSESSLVPPLFVVLLHEIGHCYYGRVHENALLEVPDGQMYIGGNFYSKVAASVMVLAPSYYFPQSMRRYYVAEILGLQRANSVEELRKFVRLSVYKYM